MSETAKDARKFKSTVGGGYRKADVNAYIESMQAQFVSVEETLKNTINHQRAELDVLRRTATATEDTEAALSELKAALAASEEAKQEAEDALAKERFRADTAEEALAALTAEFEEYRASGAAGLSAAAETVEPPITVVGEEYEILLQKAEQYDKMSARIGSVMLNANASADEILRNAKSEAETMLSGVNRELSAARTRALTSSDVLIEEISEKLSAIGMSCCGDIGVEIEALRRAIGALSDMVDEKTVLIRTKLDTSKVEMQTAARDAINRATAPRVLKQPEGENR